MFSEVVGVSNFKIRVLLTESIVIHKKGAVFRALQGVFINKMPIYQQNN